MDETKRIQNEKIVEISTIFVVLQELIITACGRKKTNMVKNIDKKFKNWYNNSN